MGLAVGYNFVYRTEQTINETSSWSLDANSLLAHFTHPAEFV